MMSLDYVSVSSGGLGNSGDGSGFFVLNGLVEKDKSVADFLNKNRVYPKARCGFGVLL